MEGCSWHEVYQLLNQRLASSWRIRYDPGSDLIWKDVHGAELDVAVPTRLASSWTSAILPERPSCIVRTGPLLSLYSYRYMPAGKGRRIRDWDSETDGAHLHGVLVRELSDDLQSTAEGMTTSDR